MLRGSTPRTVLYLPGEVEGLLAWAEGAGGVRRPDDLIGILRSDLPGALAIALRHVLEASGHFSGPPPPCTVAELARTVRLDRANLHRRAREWEVNLRKILLHLRARWVLARYRRPNQLPEIVRNLGHRDSRPLRRLVRAAVDCPLSRAHTVDPGATSGGRYSPEVRERAVRMVLEHEEE